MTERAEQRPEPSTDAASGDTDADAAAETPTDKARSAFQAAMDRKRTAGQARSTHLDGNGVSGATASHKSTRTFRRKSG
jgi:hypothetical protein